MFDVEEGVIWNIQTLANHLNIKFLAFFKRAREVMQLGGKLFRCVGFSILRSDFLCATVFLFLTGVIFMTVDFFWHFLSFRVRF